MTRFQFMVIATLGLSFSRMAFATPVDVLCYAAAKGNNREVMKIIKSGVNIDAEGDEGQPALAYAAENGHLDTMKLLLREGASLSACAGSNLNDGGGVSNLALDGAADGGYLGIVEFLIGKGLKINNQDANGYTPLLRAASVGSGPTVRYLLRLGAYPNFQTRHYGWSALMLAAQAGSMTCVKALLTHKADFTAEDNDDHTALYYARKGRHWRIASLLRRAGEKE